MGEHFIGDLTNAFWTVTVSRKRALQLIGGAIAVAAPTRLPRAAEAGKRRKPQAFVAATVDSVEPVSGTTFSWHLSGGVTHPTSGKTIAFTSGTQTASNLPADKVRAKIIADLKSSASFDLTQVGETVPEDRIAVTLL